MERWFCTFSAWGGKFRYESSCTTASATLFAEFLVHFISQATLPSSGAGKVRLFGSVLPLSGAQLFRYDSHPRDNFPHTHARRMLYAVFSGPQYEVCFLFDRSTARRNYLRFMAFWKHVLQLPNSTMQILMHQNVHLKYKYINFYTCKIHVNRVNN